MSRDVRPDRTRSGRCRGLGRVSRPALAVVFALGHLAGLASCGESGVAKGGAGRPSSLVVELSAPSAATRRAAIVGAEGADPSAFRGVPALVAALDDEDASVSEAARRVLRVLAARGVEGAVAYLNGAGPSAGPEAMRTVENIRALGGAREPQDVAWALRPAGARDREPHLAPAVALLLTMGADRPWERSMWLHLARLAQEDRDGVVSKNAGLAAAILGGSCAGPDADRGEASATRLAAALDRLMTHENLMVALCAGTLRRAVWPPERLPVATADEWIRLLDADPLRAELAIDDLVPMELAAAEARVRSKTEKANRPETLIVAALALLRLAPGDRVGLDTLQREVPPLVATVAPGRPKEEFIREDRVLGAILEGLSRLPGGVPSLAPWLAKQMEPPRPMRVRFEAGRALLSIRRDAPGTLPELLQAIRGGGLGRWHPILDDAHVGTGAATLRLLLDNPDLLNARATRLWAMEVLGRFGQASAELVHEIHAFSSQPDEECAVRAARAARLVSARRVGR